VQTKYLAIIPLALLLFLSSPRGLSEKIENQKYDTVSTSYWDHEVKYLECVNYGEKSIGGRMIFQDRKGKNIGFIPFSINPFGLLRKKLTTSYAKSINETISKSIKLENYGSFHLEASKETINCFITSNNSLTPFDHKLSETSYISLNSESSKYQINLANFSESSLFKVNSYSKDGSLVETKEIKLNKNERLIKELTQEEIGLLEIIPSTESNLYSASVILENKQIEIADSGNCKKRFVNAFHKKNNFRFTNLENESQRVFLSIRDNEEQEISNESVLIPAKTTYNMNFNNSSLSKIKIEISCKAENKILISNFNKKPYVFGEISKNKALLPIIQSKNNSLNLYGKNSIVDIELFSKSGKKILSPYKNLLIEGKLTIPLDKKLTKDTNAVALISSKNLDLELNRKSLREEEVTFPMFKLKSENIDNNITGLNVKNLKLNKRCVNRKESSIPEAFISYDSLKFKINKNKLSKSGVEKIDTFHILDLQRIKRTLAKNNFFLEGIFNKDYLNNKKYFLNNLCASLMYSSIDSRIALDKYLRHIPELSFDYKKNQEITLSGSAWLKPNPDKYLFCFKTLPDCELSKEPTSEYAKVFTSPNQTEVKPSKYYPLLTIDRPFIPNTNKNSYKIKSYIHSKVPFEIIANLNGVKQRKKEDKKGKERKEEKKNKEQINCKELNSNYYLQFENNKWINSRKNWGKALKLDLSLSYNSLTYVHSSNSYSIPKVSNRCEKFYKDCELGVWSLNISNSYNNGAEPMGWGKFHQKEKYSFRWNALPLLESENLNNEKIVFSKFIKSNSENKDCDFSEAEVIISSSKNFETMPQRLANRESKNKYILPRKIYHPDTYPLNQPAPGIPYSVKSKINPYRTKGDKMTLIESNYMKGIKWLDQLP